MATEDPTSEPRYSHFEKIGEGGLGEVYKAWDNQLQRWVAIKRVTTPSGTLDNTASLTAWQEAMRLASFSHPHIVTVYDFGRDEAGSYVVMEYLDGETLEAYVERNGALSEKDFIELMKQILEGLIAAHQKTLIHRDLKPGNIMITKLPSGRFQAKILDFGLAGFLKGARIQSVDASGSLFGSVYYMAPEQCQGGTIDARADLYALGCIGYFCLTGRRAFDGDSVDEVMQAHLEHRFVPLLQLRPDLAAPLAQWVEQLMSLSPDQRPSSAALALQSLNSLLGGSSQTQHKSPSGKPNYTHASAQQTRPSAPVAASPVGTENRSAIFWTWSLTALALVAAIGFWFYHTNSKTTATPAPNQASVPSVPSISQQAPPSATPQTTATEPSNPQAEKSSVQHFDPRDLEGLRAQIGRRVTVKGRAERWGKNKAGTLFYLNFDQDYRKALALVIRAQRFLEEDQQQALEKLVGKDIEYTGKVSEFEGRLQIFVDEIENIRVLTP
ncbi:MAG: protein kinase [Methylacidiphilales bacterium]|nr:protein kinase [Candidatus Methylacidiphilales bacterium]MDW8349828.1 serine/threonine-protein kinase [Verrucomicrobiae bacterium]